MSLVSSIPLLVTLDERGINLWCNRRGWFYRKEGSLDVFGPYVSAVVAGRDAIARTCWKNAA